MCWLSRRHLLDLFHLARPARSPNEKRVREVARRVQEFEARGERDRGLMIRAIPSLKF